MSHFKVGPLGCFASTDEPVGDSVTQELGQPEYLGKVLGNTDKFSCTSKPYGFYNKHFASHLITAAERIR